MNRVKNHFIITWSDLTEQAKDNIRELLAARLELRYTNSKPVNINERIKFAISNFEAKGNI